MKKTSLSGLKPLVNLSQVDKIEISLQEYFRNGNFMPGDAIPKEVELSQSLKVSRTAIREALSRFKILGIIESRKNRGMVITRPDVLNNMNRVLDIQLLDGETMKEIFEFRLVVELGLSDILFVRKTKEGLSKLEDIVEKEEKTTNKTELLKCDVDFHSMLYAISGNNTILRFQKMLLPIFEYVNKDPETPARPDEQAGPIVTHRDLLDTLRNGTPEIFSNKMRSHLRCYFDQV